MELTNTIKIKYFLYRLGKFLLIIGYFIIVFWHISFCTSMLLCLKEQTQMGVKCLLLLHFTQHLLSLQKLFLLYIITSNGYFFKNAVLTLKFNLPENKTLKNIWLPLNNSI
jgi:hypothetical protein